MGNGRRIELVKDCEEEKSKSKSKEVDLDDKDVKRLRKRSHSQSTESKRSIVSRSSKVSKNSERSLSNSEEKEMRTSRTEYERSTSAASDDKILENEKEDTFEREGSNGLNTNKINSDGSRSE